MREVNVAKEAAAAAAACVRHYTDLMIDTDLVEGMLRQMLEGTPLSKSWLACAEAQEKDRQAEEAEFRKEQEYELTRIRLKQEELREQEAELLADMEEGK